MGKQRNTSGSGGAGAAGEPSQAAARAAGYHVWEDGRGWRYTRPRGDHDSELFPSRAAAWRAAASDHFAHPDE